MKNLKAVKYAYSIFACALIAFGLAVLLKGWFPAEPFMLFGGILMIGFGAIFPRTPCSWPSSLTCSWASLRRCWAAI